MTYRLSTITHHSLIISPVSLSSTCTVHTDGDNNTENTHSVQSECLLKLGQLLWFTAERWENNFSSRQPAFQ